ncbi:MAG TPA: glycosyltransferase, partial [Gemmatimonadaceae bacterium]|nr:glycosyltransferase [Gemmatimonadaceae bacterium]
RLYEALQARAARACDAVVAVSRPLQEELLRRHVSAKQLHVVANACVPPVAPLTRREARQALGIPAEIWTIGWIGRLSGEKGADILFDALDGLPGFMWQAVMVGDGPERARLESRARARHPDRTYWTGALHDAARYFAAFDVIVNSSRTEGTPIVLLEAMAAGVPIVATRVGGVPDILDDTTSWLVPPAHPAALAAAVADAFRQPGLADRRARAARLRFQRDHAPREWVHRYQAVYGAALRRARTRW